MKKPPFHMGMAVSFVLVADAELIGFSGVPL